MSSTPVQVIVGLANPGKEYAETRHNAGAWFIESLAHITHTSMRLDQKSLSSIGMVETADFRCTLLVPTQFMNLNGHGVRSYAHYRKISPQSILIAHDEIDLPAGVIRLKFDGGDGGHNGLKDVIKQLGSKQFYRLRIGIGRPKHSTEVADYVLHTPSKADKAKIDDAIARAIAVLPLIMQGDIQKAMHLLHTETP